MMAGWEQERVPWGMIIGIWIVYGAAALTEGLLIFHPYAPITDSVFRSFAETVDTSYGTMPYGDSLHRAFAVVDTLFGPVFCAAGVGLLRKKRWGLFLGFGCGLTSLALLTVDLLTDVFAGFHNVLDHWVYWGTILPYYLVAALVVRYSLRHWQETMAASPPRS